MAPLGQLPALAFPRVRPPQESPTNTAMECRAVGVERPGLECT